LVSQAALDRFADVVQRDDDRIELDVAALLIGESECDVLDVAAYRGRLDDIAARAATAISAMDVASETAARPWPAARAMAATLFGELGFRGNTVEYYDPRNSFLGEVIDRRVGIPITLSVLYLEIARRVGIPAVGVGFPGHFLVRVDGGSAAPLIVDAFDGGAELGRPELATLLARTAGPGTELDDTMLEPVSKRTILTRMLTNLAGIYGRVGDLHRSLEILERQSLLDPENGRIGVALDALRRRLAALN
jgi:regulator of sirC expression with transglutaminase-like and TPR domain